MRYAAVTATLLLAASLAAHSQATPPGAAPATQPFVCGGIGTGDQQRMKSMAPQHDLMLTFAVSTGAYAGDVDVQIRDAKGTVVVSGHCDGPIMLVDLPAAGSWHVTANYNGQAREKTVSTARGRHSQATFVWPAQGNS